MNSRGGTSASSGDGGFAEAFEAAKGVRGWLTRAQAEDLYRAAAAVPGGARVVEVGTHHGRSAIVLAFALPADARLIAVDPFGSDWRYGAEGTEAACRANLAAAGVETKVELRVATSQEVLAEWQGAAALVYIDGKHDYWSVRHDLGWAEVLPIGGVLFLHDAFSSLGVTLGLLRSLTTSRRLRYVGRTGSLARLEVGRPDRRDRLRPMRDLPWWGRNLVVKVALRLRLGPLLRLLRHHDVDDPF